MMVPPRRQKNRMIRLEGIFFSLAEFWFPPKLTEKASQSQVMKFNAIDFQFLLSLAKKSKVAITMDMNDIPSQRSNAKGLNARL